MKQLELVFKMKRMLKYHSSALGLGFECNLVLDGYSPANAVVEDDGKTYHYPESFELKIENQNNHFYTFRVKDGKMLREGCTLTGPGLSVAQVYRKQLQELKDTAFRRNLDSISVSDIETYRKNKSGGAK